MDLRTSHPESDEIRRTLHNTRNEIENVRKPIKLTMEEIEKANALLEELQTTEKELHQTAEAAAQLLSPFKRIPLDIIGSIVEHVTSSNITIPYTDQSIWPLTYVCSSWRNAILSLPHLWSTFTVIGCLDPHRRNNSTHHPPQTLRQPSPSRKSKTRLNRTHTRSCMVRLGRRTTHIRETPNLTTLDIPYSFRFFPIQFNFPIHQLRHLTSTSDAGKRKIGIWDLRYLDCFHNLLTLDISESQWWSSGATDFIKQPVYLSSLTHLRLGDGAYSLITAFILPSIVSLDLYEVRVNSYSLPALRKLLDSIHRGQLEVFRVTLSVGNDDIDEVILHPALARVRSLALRHPRPSRWLASFLSRVTCLYGYAGRHRYPPDDVHGSVDGGDGPVPLMFLRHLTLEFVYHKKMKGILGALEEFIVSRTSMIDKIRNSERGGLEFEDGSWVTPVRLEDVNILFAEFMKPITLKNFRGMIELLECE